MDLSQFLAGAAAAAPTVPANPSSGFPTRGNPATGTPATTPGDYWYYQIQAELNGLLTAAGVAPNAAVLTQLVAAVRALAWDDPDLTGTPTAPSAALGTRGTRVATMQSFATEYPGSHGSDGWQTLPGGLLLQWGLRTADFVHAVTFPIAFPAAVYAVLMTDSDNGPDAAGVDSLSLTGFTFAGDGNYWMAIGK